MFRNSVAEDEKIYYDDPDSQLHTSLKFNEKNHPHQIYKTSKSNLRKMSRFFSRKFDEFQKSGGSGIQRIEIQANISHEAFDAVMRFICFTRFFPDENKKYDFDIGMLYDLYEVAFYLEIDELKKFMIHKITKGNLINKYNVWNYFALSVNLPTENKVERSEDILNLVFSFLKDNNFYTLKNPNFNANKALHKKIAIKEWKMLFNLHKNLKKKSTQSQFFLKNTDVVEMTEHYCHSHYPNQEEFKKEFKIILDEILDFDSLTEEEKLFLNNLDLFYILKEHKKFEEEAVHKYSMLAQRIEQLENQKEESRMNVEKKFEKLDLDKIGIKTEIFSKLNNLETEKSQEKETLESRIKSLENQNSDLKSTLLQIMEALQSKVYEEKTHLQSLSSSLRDQTDTLLLHHKFRKFQSSKILSHSNAKRIIKWVNAMGKDGLLDSFGKMISLNSSGVGNHGSLSLIYQASRDGANSQTFHLKCDNVANTLVVIKSSHGNLFGGYTSSAIWSSKGNYVKGDNKAFIFSLDHKIVMPVKDVERTIYGHSNYGPTFGAGNEIFISKNFTSDNGSHTNINGTSYAAPTLEKNLKYESFLGGAFHFKVEELEVFVLE